MANHKITAILIVCLMLILSLAGLTVSAPADRVVDNKDLLPLKLNYYQKYSGNILDPFLEQKLSEVSATEQLEIIIQFYDEVHCKIITDPDVIGNATKTSRTVFTSILRRPDPRSGRFVDIQGHFMP